ncbi:bifunctional [glutamate--ammonia ligase]-adenylyl-L-tyrosine phosphorylase/[glutamate--ammonia-ligase] adenylyltransferase [Glaciecola sp. MH2013]|uniref:bifunctional [glutamate--ammonia ligase]-adenylyl-L-tyrosine phosphorylase/[glutamate--ammonia-ligase] adenylyltransferase n=1 Tax=Glaciecola sp. MH2013 TaxID=2785524 RepID=UPI00189CC100|nr:bifunctional [glutamate--ammonia ligase]-adenylyl-L-tyrosine phosphorylase/[glutamate--ammonia-ligase] adenylyltransferase [Glaciecola sp. MH2013]MBF7072141.1 bifunctional [glutamate--ammonia ligase]-adenylyl-L-tyrosine phosphorylase/[glutamate--ammonia-ligase] adenylyltransferase [Glaciecola sp. MH2013]
MSTLNTLIQEAGESHWQYFIAKAAYLFQQDSPSTEAQSDYKALVYDNQALITKAFALSDFIAEVAGKYPAQFIAELPSLLQQKAHQTSGYDSALASALAELNSESELHATLRQYRHLSMAKIAWRDLLYQADIKQSLIAVSELADALINSANHWLYEQACSRYGRPASWQGEEQKLIVIGMGKLGGKELNFSSDIDLIFVYPEQGETQRDRKPVEHHSFFTKLAQRLISALHQTTADGQVYRVDMRLRPLGESGPLVISLAAFESYYLEQGRDWERFAMQKARVLSPESKASAEIQNIIRPFVYRKYLDFTTIESLRKMKQLISSEVARRQLSGNIKLGKGGIREVEFFIQALQLIHAGKVTECQTRSILASFSVLQKHGFLEATVADELLQSYLYLRQNEHYLQAFADKQTQQLPDTPLDKARLSVLNQQADYASCEKAIEARMHLINAHFINLIETSDEQTSTTKMGEDSDTDHESLGSTLAPSIGRVLAGFEQDFVDLWKLKLNENEASELLFPAFKAALNASIPSVSSIEEDEHSLAQQATSTAADIAAQLIEFKHQSHKHNVGPKGVDTLEKLLPVLTKEVLLFVFGEAELAASAIRCERISKLYALILDIMLPMLGRTAYLDLLLENPMVRQRLLSLSAKSNWVARQIKQFPLLLDELLHPAYLVSEKGNAQLWFAQYTDELRTQMLRIEADDVEAQMDALRYFKLTQQLRIAAADVSGTLPINQVSDKLSALAECLLNKTIDLAWAQITDKYGCIEGYSASNKGLGVIAYGKLGGIELGYGSDLDIVFVHDVDLSLSTNGRKQVSCSEFFVKLVQRISHLFTTKTYLNELYEIDLRLRPSGNSGLLISHIDTFRDYQLADAWTWEHQALVRARIVYGHNELVAAFQQIRQEVLALPREQVELATEVAEMRDKMREHLDKSTASLVDFKQARGGISDLEFLCQYWVLRHANTHPALSTWTDNLRILDTMADEGLLTQAEAESLQKAYLSIRNRLHRESLNKGVTKETSQKLLQAMQCINEHYSSALLIG